MESIVILPLVTLHIQSHNKSCWLKFDNISKVPGLLNIYTSIIWWKHHLMSDYITLSSKLSSLFLLQFQRPKNDINHSAPITSLISSCYLFPCKFHFMSQCSWNHQVCSCFEPVYFFLCLEFSFSFIHGFFSQLLCFFAHKLLLQGSLPWLSYLSCSSLYSVTLPCFMFFIALIALWPYISTDLFLGCLHWNLSSINIYLVHSNAYNKILTQRRGLITIWYKKKIHDNDCLWM